MGKAPAAPAQQSKKAEKINLTKQQKIRVAQMIRMENRISVCREFIQLWSKFFQFFADDIHTRQIAPEEEKAFFQTVTALARKHFLFCELMGEAFDAPGEITSVLTRSVSLANIKSMDETNFSKLELDWHTLFLKMNVALGRLLRQMPAGMKISEILEKAESTVKATKAETEASAAKGAKKKGFLGLFGKKAKA